MTANWWGISAQIAAWSGVVVILLALVAPWIVQRIKRRRRCPKCWYDLSHSPPPAMRCSECGFVAKRERKLYKARRRWRFAFLGAFMLVGAYALHLTPYVRARGWIAAVPTTAIILGSERLLYPDDERNSDAFAAALHARLWNKNDHLQELSNRIREGRLSRWNARRLALACIKALADEDRFREWFSGWGYRYRNEVTRPRTLLNSLWSAGYLTPRLGREIADRDRMPAEVPSRWPADEPLLIRAGWDRGLKGVGRSAHFGAASRCRLSASWPESTDYVRQTPWMMRGVWFSPPPWRDGLIANGVPPASGETSLELTFAVDMRLEPARSEGTTWSEVRRLQTTHFVHISGTAQDHRTGVSMPWLSEALQQLLLPTIRKTCGSDVSHNWPNPWVDEMWAGRAVLESRAEYFQGCMFIVQVPMDAEALSEIWRDIGDVTIAVRLEVFQEGVLFGTGLAWWKNDNGMPYPQGTAVPIEPVDHATEFDSEASWELRLTSDASVALRNFDSDRYWDGTATVPMTVWQPRPVPQSSWFE